MSSISGIGSAESAESHKMHTVPPPHKVAGIQAPLAVVLAVEQSKVSLQYIPRLRYWLRIKNSVDPCS